MKIKTLYEAKQPFAALIDAAIGWITEEIANRGITEYRMCKFPEAGAVLIPLEVVELRYTPKVPIPQRAIKIAVNAYNFPMLQWSYDIKTERGHSTEDSGMVYINKPTAMLEIVSTIKKYK
jgi:hypothetical protein